MAPAATMVAAVGEPEPEPAGGVIGVGLDLQHGCGAPGKVAEEAVWAVEAEVVGARVGECDRPWAAPRTICGFLPTTCSTGPQPVARMLGAARFRHAGATPARRRLDADADRRPSRGRDAAGAGRRGGVRGARSARPGDLGGAAHVTNRRLRHPHGAVCRVRRRRVRAQLRARGATAALHRAGRAELADGRDGGSQLARAGGGDRQPDPDRDARPRSRLPARAARPARLVCPARQARRPGEQRRGDPRRARRGVAGGAHAAVRAGVRRDPRRPADGGGRRARTRPAADRRPAPASRDVTAAAAELSAATRPVIWAGGGVLRSGARAELRALAERLGAPVATTYMGKGALPEDHPLSAGCGCDEVAFQELLSGADVVLAVGHRARSRDDRPVRAALRGPAHPDRRRTRADRRHLPGASGSSATPAPRCGRCSTSSATRRAATARDRSGSPPCAPGSTPASTDRGASWSAGCCARSKPSCRATRSPPGT